MDWYYAEHGKAVGPVPEAQLEQLAAEGRITAETLVRREAEADWVTYESLRSATPADTARAKPRYDIREMGLGGILDQAVALVKNHFLLLFLLFCYLVVPLSVTANLAVHHAARQSLISLDELLKMLMEGNIKDVLSVYAFPVVLLVVLYGIARPLTNGATIVAVQHSYLGKAIAPGQAMLVSLKRFWFLIWTSLLRDAAVFLVSFAMFALALWVVYLDRLLAPLAFLFMLVGGGVSVFIGGRLCLADQVVMIEGISGIAAIKRSNRIMKGHVLKGLVLFFIIFLIVLVVGECARLASLMPLQITLSIVLQTILLIFATTAIVVFYFSCRCAYENFDLVVLAEAVEEPSV